MKESNHFLNGEMLNPSAIFEYDDFWEEFLEKKQANTRRKRVRSYDLLKLVYNGRYYNAYEIMKFYYECKKSNMTLNLRSDNMLIVRSHQPYERKSTLELYPLIIKSKKLVSGRIIRRVGIPKEFLSKDEIRFHFYKSDFTFVCFGIGGMS